MRRNERAITIDMKSARMQWKKANKVLEKLSEKKNRDNIRIVFTAFK